ncbi:MAG TPA: serine/threonine-protein kinase [Kofleriaceae bacterium]|nr:serine/threonine-protein kinase [Kofleriaceae bacterium]
MRDDGDLVLGHRLGAGGAAAIYAARWRGRDVTAKVVHSADHDAAGDLAVEADVLGRVSHAALLEVLATGRLRDGRPYLVLPLLRGEDLAARLRRGPLAPPRAFEVIAAVGGALTALHAAGVVHRDLKPENVFLADHGVFLLDLGLARSLAAGTASSRIRGTYDVMAPERLYGEPAGVASEVYELAALAWAALTGALPWPAGAPPSARRGIPPLPVDGAVGPALDAVLRGALSTVPERRPASVAALVDALRDAARDPGPVPGRRRQTVEIEAARTDAAASAALPAAATGPASAAMLSVGSVIAETYRLTGVLGSGGAGTVFAAEHLRLPRRLAIKVLRPDRGDRDARVRFQREAEIIASLSHPHLVEVFDYDVDDAGAPFMVMERLEGETLRDRLRRGRLPVAEAVELVRQVASAVSAAHARGVVHRDLKPSNLFLLGAPGGAPGGAIDVRVLDFGISKVLGDPGDDTTSGLVLGSPGYAAPEQSRGDAAALGPATDVFALAAITYEALSGHRAFAAATREAALLRTLYGDPDPLRSHGVARAIAGVVHAALDRRPERRPRSAEQFAAALAAAANGRATPRQRLQRLAVAASALAALAVALQIALLEPTGATGGAAPAELAMSAAGDAAHTDRSTAEADAATPALSAAPSVRPAAGKRRVRLAVQPATAQVVIDGAPVTGGHVELSPGPHALRVTAPGYRPVDRTIDPLVLRGALDVRLSRPVRRPVDRPADRTADRPADRPADRTVDRPAEPRALPSLRDLLEK